MRSGAGLAAAAMRSCGDDLGQREVELPQTLVADGGDLEHAEAARLQIGTHQLGELGRFGHVDLVERDDLRALEQRGLAVGHRVGGQFGEDHIEIAQRVAPGLEGRAVEHVDERRAALDMAEELEAEALALARALDESGHVGDRVADVAGLDDPEVRVQRRERVVGDLRPSGRDRGDETGLARRGVADQGDIGDDLQLEEDVAFPAGGAEQREAGRLALLRGRARHCRGRRCRRGRRRSGCRARRGRSASRRSCP